jgi:hypothetical protein
MTLIKNLGRHSRPGGVCEVRGEKGIGRERREGGGEKRVRV